MSCTAYRAEAPSGLDASMLSTDPKLEPTRRRTCTAYRAEEPDRVLDTNNGYDRVLSKWLESHGWRVQSLFAFEFYCSESQGIVCLERLKSTI
jgi:hypothetical protein